MKDTSILTNNGVNLQKSLELFGDMDLYNETLSDFLGLADEKISTLEKYKNDNDMPNYAIAVHSLKSDAKYLGFVTLADMAYESELKSKAGDSVFVIENHPKILLEAKRVINISQEYMGREKTAVIPENAVADMKTTEESIMEEIPHQQPTSIDMIQPQITQEISEPINQPNSEITFFSSDSMVHQDIMSQALYMKEQEIWQKEQEESQKKQGIILVVDDSPLVANFVKKIFNEDYDVIIANDGAQAIDVINDENIRKNIKTCLLDLNMPNVNGFEVMDHFREKGFFVRTPVAIISGAEDTETLDKAKGYPIVDILAKPFNEKDVQRVVEKCLAVYF